jgi:hypothetical protein
MAMDQHEPIRDIHWPENEENRRGDTNDPDLNAIEPVEDFHARDAVQRPIVTDRRRKEALTEGMDIVAVLMSEIPRLAAVRSTILFGGTVILSVSSQ